MKKFLNMVDVLSPSITLHFKGDSQHSSLVSGILSIIVIVLIFVSGIYYFLAYINKDSPKAYFFTRYIDDAGDFPLNSESMFNYVQFIDKFDNQKIGFYFNAFIAIGTQKLYHEQYMDDPELLSTADFWIYGPCNSDSDIQGINDIVNFTILKNGACIRTYYDSERKKYYDTDENGFKWPIVKKGTSNPLSTFYGIIVQRCDKAPEVIKARNPQCKDSAYIDEVISRMSLKYQIVDHYADMLNYESPFTKYFYEVTSAVTDGIYIVNHLNFNPANMLTHNGIFFDNIVEEHAYFFTQNEKHTLDQNTMAAGRSTHGCLIGVYFWMQNTLQQYERHYDRFQDFLSDVGGISSIITTIAFYLNILINYYVTLLDTEELILNRDKANFGGNEKKLMRRKPTIFRDINQDLNYPPRKQSIAQKKSSSQQKRNADNSENSGNDEEINIYKKGDKSTKVKSRTPHRKDDVSNYSEKMEESEKIQNLKYSIDKGKKNVTIEEYSRKEDSESNHNNSYYNEKSMDSEKNRKSKKNKKDKSNKKPKLNFCKYIGYRICCGKNDRMIKYYENIRESLISEENIIQNYLDIYELLKLNNIPKKDNLINNK